MELKDEKYFCDTCTETLKGKVLFWFSSTPADVPLSNCHLWARSFAIDNINIVSYEKPNNLFMAGGSVLLCLHDLYSTLLCVLFTSKERSVPFFFHRDKIGRCCVKSRQRQRLVLKRRFVVNLCTGRLHVGRLLPGVEHVLPQGEQDLCLSLGGRVYHPDGTAPLLVDHPERERNRLPWEPRLRPQSEHYKL